MKAYTIHGFNVYDAGEATTDKLTPTLEKYGFDVVQLDYPWFGRVRTRLCNKAMAQIAAATIEPGSLILGHSNGCAVIYLMAKYGADFGHAVLINPALDPDKTIAGNCLVDVWYAENDIPVAVAKYIPFSPWGNQGRVGYTGSDRRVQNHPLGPIGHSGIFSRHALMEKVVWTAHNRMFAGESSELS